MKERMNERQEKKEIKLFLGEFLSNCEEDRLIVQWSEK